MYIKPYSCLSTADGVLCLYDLPLESVGNMDSVPISVISTDDGWFLVTHNKLLVPVEFVGGEDRSACIIRSAGTGHKKLESVVFSEVFLDVKALAKIELLIEMAS